MKRLLALMLSMLLLSACSALPAEERAFAVVLLVEAAGNGLQVHGRIPAYKADGEYLTVTGKGTSLAAALADMDANSPMRVHLSQLRLLILHENLGQLLPVVLQAVADNREVRQACMAAVTASETDAVMKALKPENGVRLSKTLDVMANARTAQGVIPSATLEDICRSGRRVSPVFVRLAEEDGEISLSGGWMTDENNHLAGVLSERECLLLSMLRDGKGERFLTLDEGYARLRDVRVQVKLSGDMHAAQVMMTADLMEASLPAEELQSALAQALMTLLERLSRSGCDALGLARQAVTHVPDAAAWDALAWQERYRLLVWSVSVGVNKPA